MAKLSKKMKAAIAKVDSNKFYGINEAMALVKTVSIASFDSSIDLHVKLGVDPRKADQAIRGTVTLPNGTGKSKKVLVLCTPDKEQEAMDAGADYAGLDEYVNKIQGGWLEFDVVIAMPQTMAAVGKLGRILGPRSLMPNPKSGTVTVDVGKAVEEVKKGKVAFRVDKYGIIHTSIGRLSFAADKLSENAEELLKTIIKMKPSTVKGAYLRSVAVAPTMGPGIKIDIKSF
ncbi:MAG: 50S ribosomal protein L1 [Deltaproteobacteria bacterium]